MLLLYVFMNVVATVVAYHEDDILPQFLKGNPEAFEYQILISYIVINQFSLQDFRFSVVTMVPIVLIGAYFQAHYEYKHLLPILNEDETAFVIRRLNRYVLIVVLYTVGHYLTQIDYTTLIIEK